MKKPAYSVSVPNPCHENWNLMQPKGDGRYCAACCKTVIDFSAKTDTEIIESLKSDPHLCGRFANTQLNRPLLPITIHYNRRWNRPLLMALMGFLSLHSENNIAEKTNIAMHMPLFPRNVFKGPDKGLVARVVKGKAVNEHTGAAIPGAAVKIMAGDNCIAACMTDSDGNFALYIDDYKGKVLTVTYLDYKGERQLRPEDAGMEFTMNVPLPEETIERYTLGAPPQPMPDFERPTLKHHIRHFFKKLRKKSSDIKKDSTSDNR